MKIKILILLCFLYKIELFTQSEIASSIKLGYELLDIIEKKDSKKFQEYLNKEVFKVVDQKGLIDFLNQGSELISKYGHPDEKRLIYKYSTAVINDKTVTLFKIEYPLPAPAKQTEFLENSISFTFAKELSLTKIVGFRTHIYRYKKLDNKEEIKIPHLEKLNFDSDEIYWYRIYYVRGISKKEIGNEEGVFASSGGKQNLEKTGIFKEVKLIFDLIENAKIEKTGYNNEFKRHKGNCEIIDLRFKLLGLKHSEIDEISVYMVIKEEDGIKEEDSEYIEIEHTGLNKYFIKKSDNKELVQKLIELSEKDYGIYLEKSP